MKLGNLQDAIKEFRDNIDDSDYANLGAKGKYLTVPYRIKFVRDFFGQRMSIQTESTELANGSHKFKANIYIDDRLVSVGESKQMKNGDKEFEKQQTVSIGRGLSILGFFGDELATAEEMEQFLKPKAKEIPKAAPIVKLVPKVKANIESLANDWIEVLKKTAETSNSLSNYEKNLNVMRKEYISDLHLIWSDLIQQARIDSEYSKQQQLITNRKI
mgnify:FL=1